MKKTPLSGEQLKQMKILRTEQRVQEYDIKVKQKPVPKIETQPFAGEDLKQMKILRTDEKTQAYNTKLEQKALTPKRNIGK